MSLRSGSVAFFILCASAMPLAAQQLAPSADAAAQAEEAKPAPYDEQLSRLAEILGSIHYLRNLCAAEKEDDWRTSMRELLDADTVNEPKRRERLTAAFNRGYRAFASVYEDCTAAAIVAEQRYRNEGATLAGEIVARFGN